MSRTLKDRPYWVRSNDLAHETVYEIHNHHRFGEPLYEWKNAKDSNGELVTKEETVEVPSSCVVVLPGGYRIQVESWREAWTYSNAIYVGRSYTTKVVKRPVTERVIVGYVTDECTIDEPYEDSKDNVYRWTSTARPCGHEIGYNFARRYYSRNRPLPDEKHVYHSGSRGKERDALKRAQRAFNSGEDMWGDEYEAANTRLQRHVGYWW